MADGTNTQLHQLGLKVNFKHTRVKLGEPVPAEVELVNQSPTKLLVNSRLGMGYPDSLDRELYCDILLENGEPYTGYHAYMLDYRRKPLADRFFTTLSPGESVSSSFDLHEWYHLVQPGIYRIRVVYDPATFATKPEAVSETIISAPITLTVQPATG